MLRIFVLLLLLTVARDVSASQLSCARYAAYAGGVVVDKQHGKEYDTLMAKAYAMPVDHETRRMLLGLTSFAYRSGLSAESVVVAVKRGCGAKPNA